MYFKMIRNIFKILPFFIVEWLGKTFGERTTINGYKAFIVFKNTYIITDEEKQLTEAERNLDSFLAELSFGQLRLKLLITSIATLSACGK